MNSWVGVGTPLPRRGARPRRSATAAPAAGRARGPRASTTSPRREVAHHRRATSSMTPSGNVHAAGAADRHRLDAPRLIIASSSGCSRIDADRRARDRGHAAPGRQPRRTSTHRSISMSALALAPNPARGRASCERQQPRRQRAVRLAEDQRVGAVCRMCPARRSPRPRRRRRRRRDRAPTCLRHHVHRLDAVLQRDDHGVGPDERRSVAAARSTSYSLTVNSTTSTGPIDAGRRWPSPWKVSVALGARRCRSPCAARRRGARRAR